MARPAVLQFAFEHCFLPPKLPQSDHDEFGAEYLLREISEAALVFSQSFPRSSNEHHVWKRLSQSLPKWIDLYDGGTPCSHKILNTLNNMCDYSKDVANTDLAKLIRC